MFQHICRFFAKHLVPRDDEAEFAQALFKWKYQS